MKREKPPPKIRVRKARSSDSEAVLKFCAKTWSWGDYIPKVWDKWLKEKNGKVFVATIEGIPVGISYITLDKPTEAWLRGARTDPNYRRMGIATAITKKCLQYAKSKGAVVARLVTESDNIAAKAAVENVGFRPVAEFAEPTTEKITKEKSKSSRWAEKRETETIWNYVKNSETYGDAAGLYTVLFHWFSLQKQDLDQFVKQRKAILHVNEKGKIDGLLMFDDATTREWHENTIQTCYIDGDYPAVFDMVKLFKNHCYSLGIKKIYGFTCNRKPITNALKKLGFEPPETTEIVYEKKI